MNYPQKAIDKTNGSNRPNKTPRPIIDGIFAFPPNRDTLGATSYLIVDKMGNILIDCPAWDDLNRQFLLDFGGVRWLFLTHRGGIGKKVQKMHEALGCEILIQEQEAYLLPSVTVTSFEREFALNPNCFAIWTPGFSPGSSCLYYSSHGGVLFSGRHLLPNQNGVVAPLPTAKTFHWFRQLRSVEALRDRFNRETLNYIIPGANTGFLRGKGLISDAHQQLSALDLDTLRQAPSLF